MIEQADPRVENNLKSQENVHTGFENPELPRACPGKLVGGEPAPAVLFPRRVPIVKDIDRVREDRGEGNRRVLLGLVLRAVPTAQNRLDETLAFPSRTTGFLRRPFCS